MVPRHNGGKDADAQALVLYAINQKSAKGGEAYAWQNAGRLPGCGSRLMVSKPQVRWPPPLESDDPLHAKVGTLLILNRDNAGQFTSSLGSAVKAAKGSACSRVLVDALDRAKERDPTFSPKAGFTVSDPPTSCLCWCRTWQSRETQTMNLPATLVLHPCCTELRLLQVTPCNSTHSTEHTE